MLKLRVKTERVADDLWLAFFRSLVSQLVRERFVYFIYFSFYLLLIFFSFSLLNKNMYLINAHYEYPFFSLHFFTKRNDIQRNRKEKKVYYIHRNISAVRIAMNMKFSTVSHHCIYFLSKPFQLLNIYVIFYKKGNKIIIFT